MVFKFRWIALSSLPREYRFLRSNRFLRSSGMGILVPAFDILICAMLDNLSTVVNGRIQTEAFKDSLVRTNVVVRVCLVVQMMDIAGQIH